MDLSILVPLYNEEESLKELLSWIRRVIDPLDLTYEVVFVDDGSSDTSWKVVEALKETNEMVEWHHESPRREKVRFRKVSDSDGVPRTKFESKRAIYSH